MERKKMKKLLTSIFIVLTLMTVVGSQYIYAEENVTSEKCVKNKHKFMDVHMSLYYELLAEKYAPDQVDVWKNISKERKDLKKQINYAKERGEALHLGSKMKPWFDEHKKLQKQFTKAIDKGDENEIKKLLRDVIALHQQLNEIYKEVLKTSN